MTDKEKRIVDKLKAIIKNTPYEGEKNTTINVLKKYCLLHNLNFEELANTEELQEFNYTIKEKVGYDYGLVDFFCTLIKKHFQRKKEDFNYKDIWFYESKKNKYSFTLKMKTSDFFEIVAEYEFYSKHYVKEYEKQLIDFKMKYFRAFLSKHSLLLEPSDDDEKELTAKEERLFFEAKIMADDIEKINYFKQIK